MPSPGCQVMALVDYVVETVSFTEAITNGDASSGTTGWGADTSTVTVVGGRFRVTNTSAVNGLMTDAGANSTAMQALVEGEAYLLSFSYVAGTAAAPTVYVGQSGASIASMTAVAGVTNRLYFIATASPYLIFHVGDAVAGNYSDYDDISVNRCDADISGNGKHLVVVGSITKTAVFPATPGVMPLTALPALPSSVSDSDAYVASCLAYLTALPTFVTELNTFANQTAITALPTLPSRTVSDAAYIATVDAYLAALPTFRTQVNVYAGGPGVWSAGGSLATARYGIAGAGTQGAGLAFGGETGAYSAVTEEYSGTAWSGGGALITARRYAAGVGAQTAALCVGGTNGSNLQGAEHYNGSAWAAGGSLATGRYGLAGCGTQAAALVFGGNTGADSAVTEEYNGASWSGGGSLLGVQNHAAGAGTLTAGLCIGGSGGGAAEEYNGTTWSYGGAMLQNGKYGLGGAGSQTAAISTAGWYAGDRVATTEEYNGAVWTAGGTVITARYIHASCGFQTQGLMMGGHDGTYAASTEEYLAGI